MHHLQNHASTVLLYTNFAIDFPSLNWNSEREYAFFVKNILPQTPLPFLEGKEPSPWTQATSHSSEIGFKWVSIVG